MIHVAAPDTAPPILTVKAITRRLPMINVFRYSRGCLPGRKVFSLESSGIGAGMRPLTLFMGTGHPPAESTF